MYVKNSASFIQKSILGKKNGSLPNRPIQKCKIVCGFMNFVQAKT